jgi:hypothetical protein
MGLRCKHEQAKSRPFPRAEALAGRGGNNAQCLSGIYRPLESRGARIFRARHRQRHADDTGRAIEIGTPMCVKIVR